MAMCQQINYAFMGSMIFIKPLPEINVNQYKVKVDND